MATRRKSVFTSSAVLFQSLPQSLMALEQTTLEKILMEIPPYATILSKLQAQGLFVDKHPVDYTIQQFLEDYVNQSKSALQCSSFQLLIKPLPYDALVKKILVEDEGYPEEFSSYALFSRVDCYIDVLCDVLCNQLAQKPYEKLSDRENVTEQEHGLQAGKIAYLLGMSLDDILALLFHDIARPSVDDPKYADVHHATEGGIILSPLGLSIDYSSSHAFAKYILHTFSPSYRELISSTSLRTLTVQAKDWSAQLDALNRLDGKKLAVATFKIALMRAIDDQSKGPTLELTKRLEGNKPDYFSDELIHAMLHKQMAKHLTQLIKTSVNRDETITLFEAKLDTAISLLLRAKEYSLHPDMYDSYQQVIDPLMGKPAVV